MRRKENSEGEGNNSHPPQTIYGVNSLPLEAKRAIYTNLIPDELLQLFQIDLSPQNPHLQEMLHLSSDSSSHVAEMALYHEPGFPDPVLYGQISDTMNGQIHVLLYVLNDPNSPRFDVDRLPDGKPTQFGTQHRNIEAEIAAMNYGLAPGQVRRGLRLLGSAIQAFERFVASLGHKLYFAEPLYYHNAVIFERYGFAYAQGRKLMMDIQQGFSPDGELTARLDGSTPFRQKEAIHSIRLRSWAIHDGLLGFPFTNVTMYKYIGQAAGLNTCPGCGW